MSNNLDRIHACLDGELPREALTPIELQQLELLEVALEDAAGALRQAPAPDLTAAVMRALPHARAERAAAHLSLAARVRRWLWTPVAVRPAYALAGVAVAVLALILAPAPRAYDVAVSPVPESPAEDARLYAQFRLEVPGASRVAVAGTFTDWQPEHELIEISPGVWSAMVPLDPGVHDYTFVIDGDRMVVDPYAPRVDDSFGGSNSRLFLPAPTGSA